MGFVTILPETTKTPLELSGFAAGYCWGATLSDFAKNYIRGLDCFNSDHMRTAEFPKLYLTIEGYSAKVIREFYTHIIDVTRLQASTRYIDYKNFEYVTPPKIENNSEALDIYTDTMDFISKSIERLVELGIPKEDASGLLPLNYSTKIIVCIGLREFMQMCRKRRCMRAYHEFRELMDEIVKQLTLYSPDYALLNDKGFFDAQCDVLGYCPESHGCGRKIDKKQFAFFQYMADIFYKEGYSLKDTVFKLCDNKDNLKHIIAQIQSEDITDGCT